MGRRRAARSGRNCGVQERWLRPVRRRWRPGEAVRWLLVAACGAAGFGVAFVIGHDDDPYEPSDWLLVVLVAVGIAALVLGPLAVRLVRRRRGRR